MQNVRLVKTLLGVGAAVLTIGLFVLSGPGKHMVDMAEQPTAPVAVEASPTMERPDIDDVASTVMTNPRFFGEDNHNRRWEIKAERAEQYTIEGEPTFRLVAVHAEAELAKGRPLAFSAGLGEFLPDAKQVSLSEGVRVAGYDYVINTQSASYDLSTGEGTGGGGVRVTGPRGQLSAPYFDLVKNGSLLRLYGGVKARIYPKGTQ